MYNILMVYLQRTYNVPTPYIRCFYSVGVGTCAFGALAVYLQHTYCVLTAHLWHTYSIGVGTRTYSLGTRTYNVLTV